MTAVEEIEAAIGRLEELRKGTFQKRWEIDSDRRVRSDGWILFEKRGSNADTTLELIVTLHRTIDAQLAILQETVDYEDGFGIDEDDTALALARAINGTAA